MHAEGRLVHVLRGLLALRQEELQSFLGWGTEMSFLFNAMRSPVAVRNALKRSKTTEGSPGLATTCPVSVKIAPEILGRGTERQYYVFIWRHADPLGNLGCIKYCKDGRENT